jgi:hypothetical protein
MIYQRLAKVFLICSDDSRVTVLPLASDFPWQSEVGRLEKTRRFRQIGQLGAKARAVTHPYLPFAGRGLDSYAAWIGIGLFDAAPTEAAWAKFNGYGHHFLSRKSLLAVLPSADRSADHNLSTPLFATSFRRLLTGFPSSMGQKIGPVLA